LCFYFESKTKYFKFADHSSFNQSPMKKGGAKEAYLNIGQVMADHFVDIHEMATIRKGWGKARKGCRYKKRNPIV
jgi:hypothetical protein